MGKFSERTRSFRRTLSSSNTTKLEGLSNSNGCDKSPGSGACSLAPPVSALSTSASTPLPTCSDSGRKSPAFLSTPGLSSSSSSSNSYFPSMFSSGQPPSPSRSGLRASRTSPAPEVIPSPMADPGEATAHTSELKSVKKQSPFGALFSRTLPYYSGPYKVGACDVEFPVEDPRRIGSFTKKDELKDKVKDLLLDGKPTGETVADDAKGFNLETVLFTLFYPADPAPDAEDRVVWFPKLTKTVAGFSRMAFETPHSITKGVFALVAGAITYGTTFPAHKDAPLLEPPMTRSESESEGVKKSKWPVVVFSHGVGCPRLMYSSICGELASRGYIVIDMEHRDGTAPYCSVTNSEGNVSHLDFLRWTDVEWPDLSTPPPDDTTLRHDQIELRVAEMDAAISAVNRIAQGGTTPVNSLGETDFRDWAGRLETESVILAGHSLGGSAVLEAASSQKFNVSHAVVYDPAMQRLDPWEGEIPCPLLVVNSEEFADSDDFDRLLEVVKTCQKDTSVLSISGATHPSFADVFLIIPAAISKRTGLRLPACQVMERTIAATEAFLAGKMIRHEEGLLAEHSSPVNGANETAGGGKRQVGRPSKPIGPLGLMVVQDLSGTRTTRSRSGTASDAASTEASARPTPADVPEPMVVVTAPLTPDVETTPPSVSTLEPTPVATPIESGKEEAGDGNPKV